MTTLGKILQRDFGVGWEPRDTPDTSFNSILDAICSYADSLNTAKSDHARAMLRSRWSTEKSGDFTAFKENKADARGNLWAWLTVSPDTSAPGWDLFKFKDAALSFLNRTCHTKGILVFEQRSPDVVSAGAGAHIHCVLRRDLDYSPRKYKSVCASSFKKYCDTSKQGAFFFQYKKSDIIRDKITYILGVKTGDGKEPKQVVDRVWRKYMNLDPVYCYNWDPR